MFFGFDASGGTPLVCCLDLLLIGSIKFMFPTSTKILFTEKLLAGVKFVYSSSVEWLGIDAAFIWNSWCVTDVVKILFDKSTLFG